MTLSRIALVLALVTSAACGGKGGAAAVDNRPPGGAPDDPVATLEALARAIETDDGAALAELVDPGGLTLWFTPGAGYAVFDTVPAGDTAPPSSHDGGGKVEDGAEYYREHYWKSAASAIRDGLSHLDRDPPDPDAPIYGDCSDEEQPYRAYLIGGRDDHGLRSMDLGGDGEVAPESVRRDLTLFNNWGFAVYLARSGDRWRVLHIAVSEPCSA